jgi:hypothetical protein
MRRGVRLPELANLRTLPATHRSVGTFGGHGVCIVILHGSVPNLGSVEFEGVQPRGFGNDEAIGTGRIGA